MSVDQSEDLTRRRAYEIWEAEGRPEGCCDAHWKRAEREIAAAVDGALSSPRKRHRAAATGSPADRQLEGASPATRCYQIKFFKRVLGGNHREVDACQWDGQEIAASEEAALLIAQQRFCQNHGLRHWSIHADRYQVVKARASSHADGIDRAAAAG